MSFVCFLHVCLVAIILQEDKVCALVCKSVFVCVCACVFVCTSGVGGAGGCACWHSLKSPMQAKISKNTITFHRVSQACSQIISCTESNTILLRRASLCVSCIFVHLLALCVLMCPHQASRWHFYGTIAQHNVAQEEATIEGPRERAAT